ncbi:MAG: DUF1772 domain-containing protein [Chloroflexota bacterium]
MIEARLFTNLLIVSTLFVALVAGLVFTFALITMPGIKRLDDREFIRAFQVMDGIIQGNQPLFIVVWAGSVVTLLAAAALGFRQLDGIPQWLLIAATVLYLFGVQLPTIRVNIPLNNELQTLDVSTMNTTALSSARQRFEPHWNRWNTFRTVIAVGVTVMLLIVLRLL